jgi:hypothetical protein
VANTASMIDRTRSARADGQHRAKEQSKLNKDVMNRARQTRARFVTHVQRQHSNSEAVFRKAANSCVHREESAVVGFAGGSESGGSHI